MPFESRRTPKSAQPHECRTPSLRWLPLIVWPRWREGATWRCPRKTYSLFDQQWHDHGCGQLWRWTLKAKSAMPPDFWEWRRIEG